MANRVTSFAEMTDTALECRAWTHPWKHKQTFVERDGRTPVVRFLLRCTNCKGEREDTHRRSNGELLKRTYRHPNGYLISKPDEWGGRKVFNQNAKLELIERKVADAER